MYDKPCSVTRREHIESNINPLNISLDYARLLVVKSSVCSHRVLHFQFRKLTIQNKFTNVSNLNSNFVISHVKIPAVRTKVHVEIVIKECCDCLCKDWQEAKNMKTSL